MKRNTKEAIAARAEARRVKLKRELARMLPLIKRQQGVRSVILFGSTGRQNVRSQSDLDLAIVQDTDKRFLDRLDEFYRLLVPSVSTDILVYTPQEWNELKQSRCFVQRISDEGRILYDATEASGG